MLVIPYGCNEGMRTYKYQHDIETMMEWARSRLLEEVDLGCPTETLLAGLTVRTSAGTESLGGKVDESWHQISPLWEEVRRLQP